MPRIATIRTFTTDAELKAFDLGWQNGVHNAIVMSWPLEKGQLSNRRWSPGFDSEDEEWAYNIAYRNGFNSI